MTKKKTKTKAKKVKKKIQSLLSSFLSWLLIYLEKKSLYIFFSPYQDEEKKKNGNQK